MIKKTVKYTNFNDEQKTADLYFNLSKTELVETRFENGESFIDDLEKIREEEDVLKIYNIFKNLVLKAYGERSEDGERFIKSPEALDAFQQSAAFDEMIYQMMLDPKEFVTMIYNLIPSDLRAELQKDGKLPTPEELTKQVNDAEKANEKQAATPKKAASPAKPSDRKPKAAPKNSVK